MIHAAAFSIVLALFWVLPSVLVARIAARRGRTFEGWLLAAMFLCWPIVLLVALIVPRRDRAA